CLTLLLLITCTSGALLAQSEYKLDAFDEISITGNIEVILEKSDVEKAIVETFGIPEDELNIGVRGQVLKLSLLNSIFYKHDKVKVKVYYKNLRAVRAHAGAELEATAALEGDALEIRTSSGADVLLDIKANKLEASATEGAILQLRGEVDNLKVSASTGGQLRALDLMAKNTYARAGTGGEVRVVALESLDANASLGGSIEYKGDPDERNRKTILGGDVRKIQ
ncbi:MAG: head GIN domain-containing protein, partial [Saprospiraceae bacterium]